MEELNISSFSKINIGLNIISKRDDGFHDIQTVFYPLSLCDEITIRKSEKFHFSSNNQKLSEDKNNLIIKAHKLIEQMSGKKISCEIFLKKQIPIGAGLGGGSSNAASVLKGLNRFFSLEIENSVIAKIALQLGSDVPLFLVDLPAYAESRGEKLIPVKIAFDGFILLVNPGIHISTKWAFSKINPKLPAISLKSLIKENSIDFYDLVRYAKNDFEEIIFNEFPEIKDIKDRMLQFGSVLSLMTGTGSTVFGFFEEEEAANQAELFFKCKNYFTYLERVN